MTAGTTLFTVQAGTPTGQAPGAECVDGSEAAYVTASFRKAGIRVKPNPYCPECTTTCDAIHDAQAATVEKTARKYLWWDILGEGDVQPAIK